jgi:hypothetical protein
LHSNISLGAIDRAVGAELSCALCSRPWISSAVVQLRRSKTDQEADGYKLGLPFGCNPRTCPARAVRDWLAHGGIQHRPLLRAIDRHGNLKQRRHADQSVALIVKRRAREAGLDVRNSAGHSWRSGLPAAAATADVSQHAGGPPRSARRR